MFGFDLFYGCFRPEEKIRVQEQKIMQLIEEACVASNEGDCRKALTKAKDASNKERSLIRMQEQMGLADQHNLDLTFSVCCKFCCTCIVYINNDRVVAVIIGHFSFLYRSFLRWQTNMQPMNNTQKP